MDIPKHLFRLKLRFTEILTKILNKIPKQFPISMYFKYTKALIQLHTVIERIATGNIRRKC